MRELNVQEVEQVSGGYLPLIQFGAALVRHHTSKKLTQAITTRVATPNATYQAAKQLDEGVSIPDTQESPLPQQNRAF
ncbi:hypothetical protein [Marinobacter sp. HL-58]|uniref:hypothetical protein n=1 Tax=Marinobacter sp. HL-58 TaxID=1479237 RepID=UPI000484B545|nr:hypothetical protein [Marinobacter sp. HL-58]KPP99474.1 MAG: class II bacteriocin [Marinobacter sp. HL-58]